MTRLGRRQPINRPIEVFRSRRFATAVTQTADSTAPFTLTTVASFGFMVGIDSSPYTAVGVAAGTPIGTYYTIIPDSQAGPFKVGSRLQLTDSTGTLKEATVFTITGITSGFGFTNLLITPNSAVITTAGDLVKMLGYSIGLTSDMSINMLMDSSRVINLTTLTSIAVNRDANATAPLTFSASATVGVTRPFDSTAPLTLSVSAAAVIPVLIGATPAWVLSTSSTISVSKGLDATLAMTLAATSTATRNAVFASTASFTYAASSTAFLTKLAASTAPLAFTATAGASVTRPSAATAPLSLSSSATAFNTTVASSNTTAMVLGTTATLDIAGQTVALRPLVLAVTGTSFITKLASSTAPLVLGLTADIAISRGASATPAFSLDFVTDSLMTRPIDASIILGNSASATMFVTHPMLADDGDAYDLIFSASMSRTDVFTSTAPLSLASNAVADVLRPGAINPTSVVVTLIASATISRGVEGISALSLGVNAIPAVNRDGNAASQLYMTTVAAIDTGLVDGAQSALFAKFSGTATVASVSSLEDTDLFELEIQRQLTTAYIAENALGLILRPNQRVPSNTGGFILTEANVRVEQRMRLIETAGIVETGVQRTDTGFMRRRNYILLAEWNSIMEIDDTFTHEERDWIIRSFLQYNGYERRAVVERIGI